VRARIGAGLDEQGRDVERGMLEAIRAALPADAVTAWDMTILAYWAAAHYAAPAQRRFLYPLGSGTLGYAWPAAIGAALATPGTPAIAVAGDGGILYGLNELASARQHGADVKLVLVDDGGYGILREYQSDAYGQTNAVDLVQPDFAAVAEAFGVPVRSGTPDDLGDMLGWALGVDGPAVVVVRAKLTAAAPTS
jgi:acetolactate synthase-1/2/3 large subunit